MQEIIVALDGSGDFTTIQEAVNSIRVHPLEPVIIHVKSGIYQEKIMVPDNKPEITIKGESAERTIISCGDNASMLDETGKQYGTFRTPTLTIAADDFTLENVTVVNSSGPSFGQALALYIAGDRIQCRNVRMLGWQDTLYTSRGRHYYKDCYIEGHVDFIFGSAAAVFDGCEIHSLRGGYITAASTPSSMPFGYVFMHCRLTGAAPEQSVYLGRPWRPHAHTAFIHTWMGEHIRGEGWHNWRNPDNERTARYDEFGSTGPGARLDERTAWSRQLTEEEVSRFTISRILGGSDGWNPAS